MPVGPCDLVHTSRKHLERFRMSLTQVALTWLPRRRCPFLVNRYKAFKSHILTKKTTKSKRQRRGSAEIHSTNMDSVRAMMPNA